MLSFSRLSRGENLDDSDNRREAADILCQRSNMAESSEESLDFDYTHAIYRKIKRM
jgi:hypothetical protein